jgi:hypothetical protein
MVVFSKEMETLPDNEPSDFFVSLVLSTQGACLFSGVPRLLAVVGQGVHCQFANIKCRYSFEAVNVLEVARQQLLVNRAPLAWLANFQSFQACVVEILFHI